MRGLSHGQGVEIRPVHLIDETWGGCRTCRGNSGRDLLVGSLLRCPLLLMHGESAQQEAGAQQLQLQMNPSRRQRSGYRLKIV